MEMNVNRLLETQIANHRDWLKHNGERILARDSQYLREDLASGSMQAFRQVPGSLDGLAICFGVRGTLGVLDGCSTGWREIATALDLVGWSVMIHMEILLRDKGAPAINLTNYLSRIGCLACISPKWGSYAAKLLQRIATEPGLVDQSFWQTRKFEPFVLRCLDMQASRTSNPIDVPAPYQAIFAGWHNSAEFADAMHAVCDYHCQSICDDGDDWRPEFAHPPFDLIPCEYLLIRNVRQGMGLSTPDLQHPLVSMLGFEAQKIEGFSDHPLVQEVEAAFVQW